MIIRLLAGAALGAMLSACATLENEPVATTLSAPQATGYFAAPSTLPFHAPDFTKLSDADFQPAIEQGIAIKRAEISAIADNPAPPTFDNTLVAMQRAGQVLARARAVFDQLVAANTNTVLDAADAALAPQLAALNDDTYLNARLFARVKAVYDARAAMSMTPEDAMLLETTYADFVHAGALLDAGQKERLKALNGRIAGLETEFGQKLTEATAARSPVFGTRAELAGLSEAQIQAAAALATKMGQPGKFALALINITQQPLLTSLTNRATRRALFEASINRTSSGDANDTTDLIEELAELRAQRAALLGLPDHATYAMYDRMVKEPAKAIAFMRDFVPALAATQQRERAMLEEMARADGINGALEPWDWSYYAEKVRKARYDIDQAAIRPYFEVWRTLEDGVFPAMTQFYGVMFQRRTDLPTYHPDMRVYTVFDKDGSELALFYFDPFARPNKRGGAWMGNFVDQSHLLGLKPVIHNTLNVTPPQPGEPALMTFDDVTTTFHEFGHAIHGMFADQRYPSLSGTSTARDFVEFPSQFHENLATIPAILNRYARHYQTGAPIPAELVAKLDAAAKFNQGLEFGETLTAALLDMEWHRRGAAAGRTEAEAFEAAALGGIGLDTRLIPPRYRSPYFRHIWSNGYSAGYYSYIWTEMLAHDAWDWIEQNGGPTRANGDHVRATFLGQGHTKDYGPMYRDYAGRDPAVEPMLRARGLAGGE
ncbi:MAG: dipeptidyl carboxypeptidase II [Sphingomonadales bacterium 32-68-7]|nr:MAG: dipeptidyl carboxypeptidase II [Sphingomonadales bacterium 12-68-11]OYX09271.1 MAG: dipeptidyl carboxypeptidase II [Sphingomonadales bacterium 32-68-7]